MAREAVAGFFLQGKSTSSKAEAFTEDDSSLRQIKLIEARCIERSNRDGEIILCAIFAGQSQVGGHTHSLHTGLYMYTGLQHVVNPSQEPEAPPPWVSDIYLLSCL